MCAAAPGPVVCAAPQGTSNKPIDLLDDDEDSKSAPAAGRGRKKATSEGGLLYQVKWHRCVNMYACMSVCHMAQVTCITAKSLVIAERMHSP